MSEATKKHANILKIKKFKIFLPKNLPKTHEKRRFKKGKIKISKYMITTSFLK